MSCTACATRDSHAVGVVVGAGGTARAALYALQQLGFQKETLVLVNPRTPAKVTFFSPSLFRVAKADLILLLLKAADSHCCALACVLLF